MNRDSKRKHKVNLQMTVTSRRNAWFTSHLRETEQIFLTVLELKLNIIGKSKVTLNTAVITKTMSLTTKQ